jgi:hypothetical protein
MFENPDFVDGAQQQQAKYRRLQINEHHIDLT